MGLQVDVRKLDLFNQMAREGSGTVADHLGQLTGLDASVHTSRINFLDIDDVTTHIGTDRQVGIYVELNEPPYGYVLFMLDPADSKRLAGAMMGRMGEAGEGEGFSEMERSAIRPSTWGRRRSCWGRPTPSSRRWAAGRTPNSSSSSTRG